MYCEKTQLEILDEVAEKQSRTAEPPGVVSQRLSDPVWRWNSNFLHHEGYVCYDKYNDGNRLLVSSSGEQRRYALREKFAKEAKQKWINRCVIGTFFVALTTLVVSIFQCRQHENEVIPRKPAAKNTAQEPAQKTPEPAIVLPVEPCAQLPTAPCDSNPVANIDTP